MNKIKYFTECIPLPLAEKLKEKGMPDIEIVWNPIRGEHYCFKTYAEVFDWLMEKGVYIFGFRRFDSWRWEYATEWRFRIEREDISQEEVNGSMVNGYTWHSTANAAIEKALTLI